MYILVHTIMYFHRVYTGINNEANLLFLFTLLLAYIIHTILNNVHKAIINIPKYIYNMLVKMIIRCVQPITRQLKYTTENF